MKSISIQEFVDATGKSPFAKWFDDLAAVTAAKVTVALSRLGAGNFSNVEGVGGGVFEYKIDFGPGYRIYFGKESEHLVILLCGSSKKDQQKMIDKAKAFWKLYKASKR